MWAAAKSKLGEASHVAAAKDTDAGAGDAEAETEAAISCCCWCSHPPPFGEATGETLAPAGAAAADGDALGAAVGRGHDWFCWRWLGLADSGWEAMLLRC